MAKKKKGWVCNRCESFTVVARKGKQRVMWCPRCDIVLAHNPIPLLSLAAAAAPSIIGGAKKLYGKLAGRTALSDGGEAQTPSQPHPSQKIIYDSLDRPNKSERYVRMALER